MIVDYRMWTDPDQGLRLCALDRNSRIHHHTSAPRLAPRDEDGSRMESGPHSPVCKLFLTHHQLRVYCSATASKQLQFVNFIEAMMNNHESVGDLRSLSPLYRPAESRNSILNQGD